jgi:hypothetical protein
MNTQHNDPKGAAGALKTPLSLIPPFAMEQTAWVHKLGAEKYGPFNWRETGVCASTYVNAIMRHLNAWRDGENLDPESGISHLAHVACSCNILLDADHCGTLQDDRNVKPQNINYYYVKPDDSTKEGDKFCSNIGLGFTNSIIGSEHRRIDEGEPFIEGDELYCNCDDLWIPVLHPSGKICCWKDLARRKIEQGCKQPIQPLRRIWCWISGLKAIGDHLCAVRAAIREIRSENATTQAPL